MGKKSTPAPPPAPDPVATANAQSAANTATAREQQRLNMVGSYGPEGSVTWRADENSPGGYSQFTTLSPEQQRLYDSSLNTQVGAVDIANQQLGRVGQALGQNINAPHLQGQIAPAGPITTGLPGAGPIQGSVDTGAALRTGYDAGGQIQRQVGPTDFTADRQAVTDNVWQQAISRLDPMYGQRQDRLDTRLANQGIGMNSAAYGNAQDTEGRARNDAYNQALYSAVNQGAQEQNTLFGQALQQGQFANQAQQQANAQNAQQAGFFNDASLSEFQRNLEAARFANEAQAQGFDQGLVGSQFANQAQAQQYGQNANNAQFGNETAGNQFQMDQYAQQAPINQLSALLGLGQVQMPQGFGYSPTQVGLTDTLGAQALSTGVQQNNYNQQMQAATANRTALLGGLAQLGGSALSAAKFSDERLKTDIVKIGQRADGLGLYLYRYFWSPIVEIGVMAQEVLWVKPEAVVVLPTGIMAVDYGAL